METVHADRNERMSPQEIIQDIGDRIIRNPPYEQNETIKKIAKVVTDIKTDNK